MASGKDSAKGLHWFHTSDGVNYRGLEARSAADLPGRSEEKRPKGARKGSTWALTGQALENVREGNRKRAEKQREQKLLTTRRTDQFLSEERKFYVYIFFDRQTGGPCYVGKGFGERAYRSLVKEYNPLLRSISERNSWDLPVVLVREELTEKEAFGLEVSLIAAIGRIPNGPLVNMDDGGTGASGLSPEARFRMGAGFRGKKLVFSEKHLENLRAANRSPERNARLSATLKDRTFSEEHREALRSAFNTEEVLQSRRDSARSSWASLTEEERAQRIVRIREGTKKGMQKPGVRERISTAMVGRVQTEEQRKANSEGVKRYLARNPEHLEYLRNSRGHLGHKHSPEAKVKMREARRSRNTKERSVSGSEVGDGIRK